MLYGINLLIQGNNQLFCREIDCGQSTPKLGGSISLTGFTGALFLNGPASRALEDFTCENNDIEELTGYDFLRSFRVGYNKLSGSAPIIDNNILKIYKINNNYYSGRLPALTGYQFLEVFAVQEQQGDIKFTGTMSTLSLSTRIKYYNISSNQITGIIPQINQLTGLLYFMVNDNYLNQISNTFLPQNLIHYDISNNYIDDSNSINGILRSMTFFNNDANNKVCLLAGGLNSVPSSGFENPDYKILTGKNFTISINKFGDI
jgi:hypothetical protein